MKKQIKTRPLYRDAAFDETSIDTENRTVELAFSSEAPVERWFGIEVLDHDPEAVDMERLQDGAALLMDHDWADQVGVIDAARIDEDKRGRALVRFSKSARGEEVFQDVIDRIRTKVSFGYAVKEMKLEREVEDGPDEFRVSRWQPFEISLVSVPADNSVGIGRTLEAEALARHFGDEEISTRIITPDKPIEEVTMSENKATPTPAPEVDVDELRREVQAVEAKRVDQILAVANKYDMHDEAREAIKGNVSLSDFRERVLDKVEEQRAQVRPEETSAIEADDLSGYSLMKAIRAQASGDWSKAGLELEASRACMERMGGKDPRGFYVPFEAMSRVQSVGTAAEGGNIVATDLMAGSFIEMLRANSLAGAVGVTYLPGLVGNVDIPKQTVGGSFGWIAEDGSSAETDIEVGKVSLTPETISGSVYMTRRSLMQTTPAIETLVRNDIVRGMGLALDAAIFEGPGTSNSPLGVANAVGVNTQTIAANATTGYPTFAELVGFETAVETDNALAGSLSYVTTPAIYAGLRTTAVDSGSGIFLADKVGYPIYKSTQLDSQRILFGNFSDVLVGMWGALDLNVDTATAAAKGGLWLRAFQDANVAVRHAESFCKNSLPA